jgi:2-phosphoglycerate kinase
MIYLIGGPPKCGKTTLAKVMSKKLGIPWVSSDTLQVVSRAYVLKHVSKDRAHELYPLNAQKFPTNDERYTRSTPVQIAKDYIKQARASYDAIDMFSICEITDGNDYVVEGYHVTPQLASKLMKKYGKKHFRAIFLVKSDIELFVNDARKSTTPHDWILRKTKKNETVYLIAEMVRYYGEYVVREAKKYNFKILNMDIHFNNKIEGAIALLVK